MHIYKQTKRAFMKDMGNKTGMTGGGESRVADRGNDGDGEFQRRAG